MLVDHVNSFKYNSQRPTGMHLLQTLFPTKNLSIGRCRQANGALKQRSKVTILGVYNSLTHTLATYHSAGTITLTMLTIGTIFDSNTVSAHNKTKLTFSVTLCCVNTTCMVRALLISQRENNKKIQSKEIKFRYSFSFVHCQGIIIFYLQVGANQLLAKVN